MAGFWPEQLVPQPQAQVTQVIADELGRRLGENGIDLVSFSILEADLVAP